MENLTTGIYTKYFKDLDKLNFQSCEFNMTI